MPKQIADAGAAEKRSDLCLRPKNIAGREGVHDNTWTVRAKEGKRYSHQGWNRNNRNDVSRNLRTEFVRKVGEEERIAEEAAWKRLKLKKHTGAIDS